MITTVRPPRSTDTGPRRREGVSERLRPFGLSWILASELFASVLGFAVMVYLARRLGPSSFAEIGSAPSGVTGAATHADASKPATAPRGSLRGRIPREPSHEQAGGGWVCPTR